MTFGELIQARRQDRGMTQAQVAAALGCTESTVRNYEAGRQIPKVDRAVEIMRLLNIDFLEGARAVGGDL